MINWIEATLTNIKKYNLYGFMSLEHSKYIFLINGKHVAYDDELYLSYDCYENESERPENGSLTILNNNKLKVTHFALKSEYEAILPKGIEND